MISRVMTKTCQNYILVLTLKDKAMNVSVHVQLFNLQLVMLAVIIRGHPLNVHRTHLCLLLIEM